MKNAVEENHADAKKDKKEGRHQAKDHAQLLMLRDSFFGLDTCPLLPHSRVGGRLTMPKYYVCSGGNSAEKRDRVEWETHRFYILNHCELLFALRTAHDEIYRHLCGNIFQRNKICMISRLRAGSKDKILCVAAWIGTIERRKSKTIFCNSVFQFRSVPSAINAYDKSLSRSPEFAARPR